MADACPGECTGIAACLCRPPASRRLRTGGAYGPVPTRRGSPTSSRPGSSARRSWPQKDNRCRWSANSAYGCPPQPASAPAAGARRGSPVDVRRRRLRSGGRSPLRVRQIGEDVTEGRCLSAGSCSGLCRPAVLRGVRRARSGSPPVDQPRGHTARVSVSGGLVALGCEGSLGSQLMHDAPSPEVTNGVRKHRTHPGRDHAPRSGQERSRDVDRLGGSARGAPRPAEHHRPGCPTSRTGSRSRALPRAPEPIRPPDSARP